MSLVNEEGKKKKTTKKLKTSEPEKRARERGGGFISLERGKGLLSTSVTSQNPDLPTYALTNLVFYSPSPSPSPSSIPSFSHPPCQLCSSPSLEHFLLLCVPAIALT